MYVCSVNPGIWEYFLPRKVHKSKWRWWCEAKKTPKVIESNWSEKITTQRVPCMLENSNHHVQVFLRLSLYVVVCIVVNVFIWFWAMYQVSFHRKSLIFSRCLFVGFYDGCWIYTSVVECHIRIQSQDEENRSHQLICFPSFLSTPRFFRLFICTRHTPLLHIKFEEKRRSTFHFHMMRQNFSVSLPLSFI